MRMHFALKTSLALSIFLALVACGGPSSDPDYGTGSSSSSSGGGAGGPGPTLVDTDKGPVQGSVVGQTRVFLGIPFAAPPEGDLRWKPPQPAEPWTDARDATKKGLMCPQFDPVGGALASNTGEDCLTLNLWTPERLPAAPTPVLVWIHGGAFAFGSGSDAQYDGRLLSEATGAVVVTINYRMGPMGFFAHSALFAEDSQYPSAGMYGFEDERAALAWVKQNIAAFAGDPSNVTLFGESAGGMSTCLHMISPKTQGLFHRAIIESGACTVSSATRQEGEAQATLLADALGCTDPATVLACLRAKTADEVMLAIPPAAGGLLDQTIRWFPIVDGWNLPDDPSTLVAQGSFTTQVPVIIGTNQNEGTIFFALGTPVTDDMQYAALMEKFFPGQGATVVAKYPSAMFASPQAAAAEAIGDAWFVCPTRTTARGLSQAGIATYRYHFVHAAQSPLLPGAGAFHSSEIPFIFGNPFLGIVFTPEEQALSKAMIGYWSRMAQSGDPNGGGAFAWPKYAAATDEHMVLDLTFSTAAALKNDICNFWDGLAP